MTATLISLMSILIGIIGGNATGMFFSKYSFGFIGNTILGVFGSAFLIKSIGRLGFGPEDIVHSGVVDLKLFLLNMFVSFIGGALLVVCVRSFKNKIDKG